MSEWRETSTEKLIREGVLFIGDGYRAKNNEFASDGIPFARVTNIKLGELDLTGADLFPEDDLERVGNKISQPGDVVFTSKGTVGRFIFVRKNTPKFIYSPQISFWRVLDKNVIEPRFILYWMKSREFVEQIYGLKSQTDMADYVSLSDQRQMRITLPPLPVQRRIAQILGRLDDKIEVNRRIDRTLEAMARALYRHWFVDFGPFQDGAFVESDLGPIPKGWEVKRLDGLLELAYGKGLPKKVREPGPFPVVGSSGIIDFHSTALFSGPGLVVGRKGTIGKLSWVQQDFWPIDTTYCVIPKRKIYSLEYLYHVLAELNLENRNTDSAVPGLNRKETYRLLVIVPPDSVLREFNQTAKPWFAQMQMNRRESDKLSIIRDYLLQKLLRGSIPL